MSHCCSGDRRALLRLRTERASPKLSVPGCTLNDMDVIPVLLLGLAMGVGLGALGAWLLAAARTRAAVAEAYRVRSGRSIDRLDYYVAFAYWRWSCINLGTRRRLLDGVMPTSALTPARIDAQIDWQLDRARELLDTSPAS